MQITFSRPAFGRLRPKVTIMALAYMLQTILGPFHQNVSYQGFHTIELMLQTILGPFHQNVGYQDFHPLEDILQTILGPFHQNVS